MTVTMLSCAERNVARPSHSVKTLSIGASENPCPSLNDHVGLAEMRSMGNPVESSAFRRARRDRKSTRLNSSHRCISYAVFCLKKKKKKTTDTNTHNKASITRQQ